MTKQQLSLSPLPRWERSKARVRLFAEFVLSVTRSFASLRMTHMERLTVTPLFISFASPDAIGTKQSLRLPRLARNDGGDLTNSIIGV